MGKAYLKKVVEGRLVWDRQLPWSDDEYIVEGVNGGSLQGNFYDFSGKYIRITIEEIDKTEED